MTQFTAERLESLRQQIRSGDIQSFRPLSEHPEVLERVQVSDDVVLGLRADVPREGPISLHVSYRVGDTTSRLHIGHLPETSIEEARSIARSVQALAEKGVDVRDGLLERLVADLKAEAEAPTVVLRLVPTEGESS